MSGHRSDYDGWAALGNQGWAYDDVLPYFKKAPGDFRQLEAQDAYAGPAQTRSSQHLLSFFLFAIVFQIVNVFVETEALSLREFVTMQYINVPEVPIENADNCGQLAERAADEPTYNRYKRMEAAWLWPLSKTG